MQKKKIYFIIGLTIVLVIALLVLMFGKSTGFANLMISKSTDAKTDSKLNKNLEIHSKESQLNKETKDEPIFSDNTIDKAELEKQQQLLELSSKENIIIEYNYDTPTITKDFENKDIITISNLTNLNIPGEPEVPFEVAMIMIPIDKDIDKVTVIPGEKIDIKGTYDLRTGDWQVPISHADKIDITELEKNKTIFKTYPKNYYSNPSVQLKKGYKFAIFNLYPVEYQQSKKLLSYYTNFTVVVTLKSGDIPKSFRPNNIDDQKEIREWVISQNGKLNFEKDLTYEKYQEISKSVAKKTNLSALHSYLINPKEINNNTQPHTAKTTSYKYIIITTQDFGEAFQPLIYWKTTRPNNPITAGIFYIEDILNDPRFSCTGEYNWGDGCGQYNQFDDDAARLRNFIRFVYTTYDTEYVLLGGDADYENLGPGTETEDVIIPSRYIGANDYDPENPGYFNPLILSDMYFANLDGSFDQKGDGVFRFHYNDGDWEDTDYLPEVAIGRAPFDNTNEINNWVAKTIAAEQITDYQNLNHLFVGEFLGFGGMMDFAGPSMDEIITGSTNHGINTAGFSEINQNNIYRLYDSYDNYNPPFSKGFSPQDLLDLMNEINPYVINHLGHGNANYLMKFQVYHDYEEISDLNAGSSFINSQACYSGAFDNFSGYTHNRDSISEYLLSLENGPFGMITNSRYGWGSRYSTDGPSQIMQRRFWNNAFMQLKKNIGWLNNLSKVEYLLNNGWVFVYLETNLLGDPEIEFKLPTVNNILSLNLSQDIINSTYYQEDFEINININNLTDVIQNSILHVYFDNYEIHNLSVELNPGENQINYIIDHNLYFDDIGEYKTIKVIIDKVDSEVTYDNTYEMYLYIYNTQFYPNQTIYLSNQIIDCNTPSGQNFFGIDTNKVALNNGLYIRGQNITFKNCEFIGFAGNTNLSFSQVGNLFLNNNQFKEIHLLWFVHSNNINIIENNTYINYFDLDEYLTDKTRWAYTNVFDVNIYDNNFFSKDITQTNINLYEPINYFKNSSNINIMNNNYIDVSEAISIIDSEYFNIVNNKFEIKPFPIRLINSIQTNNSQNIIILSNKFKNYDINLINSQNIDFNENILQNSRFYSDEFSQQITLNNNVIRHIENFSTGVWIQSPVKFFNNKICVSDKQNQSKSIVFLHLIDCNMMYEISNNFNNNILSSIYYANSQIPSQCSEYMLQHGVHYCYCNEKFGPNGVGCVPDLDYMNTWNVLD